MLHKAVRSIYFNFNAITKVQRVIPVGLVMEDLWVESGAAFFIQKPHGVAIHHVARNSKYEINF